MAWFIHTASPEILIGRTEDLANNGTVQTQCGRRAHLLPSTPAQLHRIAMPDPTDCNGESRATCGQPSIRFRHTADLPLLLQRVHCTLLAATAAPAGVLVAGAAPMRGNGIPGLTCSFTPYDDVTGIAVGRQVAVAGGSSIWIHDEVTKPSAVAAQAGGFGKQYVARAEWSLAEARCDELAWGADGAVWVLDSRSNRLVTIDEHGPLDSANSLASNLIDVAGCGRVTGFALHEGVPRFVTIRKGDGTTPATTTRCEGEIVDLVAEAVIAGGLSDPGSPRLRRGRLWLLDRGNRSLIAVDLADGRSRAVTTFDERPSGLAFWRNLALVSFSEKHLADARDAPGAADLHSPGILVVDMATGAVVGRLQIEAGVGAIRGVQLLTNTSFALICGPQQRYSPTSLSWSLPNSDETSRYLAEASRSLVTTTVDRDSLLARAIQVQQAGRMTWAVELLQHAVNHPPPSAIALNDLGNAWQEVGDLSAAISCYRRASAHDRNYHPARQNYGLALIHQGRVDAGRRQLEEAPCAAADDVSPIIAALALPPVYASVEDLRQRRAAMVHRVDQLLRSGLQIDTRHALAPTNFRSAYQGENDRDLQEKLGQLYRGHDVCPHRRSDVTGRPIRLGVISAHLRDHTIGRLNVARLERLSRSRFDWSIFSVGRYADAIATRLRNSSARYIVLPAEINRARQAIARQRLDLLLFTDVGMDPLSSTLAFSRMAPVQAVTWGHPVTTGSPHIDYYLSSTLLEPPGAHAHYNEQLACLETMGVCYEAPKFPAATAARSQFGLSESATLYACPQSLFKFHPDFDSVLRRILQSDHRAEIVLIEAEIPYWTEMLRSRFRTTMPNEHRRVRWLPRLPRDRYLDLLRLADVVLDPLHFGGGNSSYEALAAGVPVVTLSGRFLRGRITQALYAKMAAATKGEARAPVAVDEADYAALAVSLANDAGGACRDWIAAHRHVLFDDEREAAEFADCLAALATDQAGRYVQHA